jgi:exonuclease SbcC
LSAVNLAVIVGKNGSGKSALVDAITFAPFGEGTRGNVKALDNYVARGRNECVVDETFDIGDKIFRVVRSRNLKRNKTNLSFYIQDRAGWVDLSGNTLADTQAKIEEVLRIDYKTFASSSLILQGQSGNFMAMPESERRDAVFKIFGLDIWDKMLDRVKETQKLLKTDALLLTNQESTLLAVVEGKPALIKSLTSLTAKRDVLNGQIADTDLSLSINRDASGQEPVLRSSIVEIDKSIASQRRIVEGNDDKMVNANTQIEESERQIKLCQDVLARREEINAAAKAETELGNEVIKQEANAKEYGACDRDAFDFERKSAVWDKETESAIARLETRIESAKQQTAVMGQVPCGDDAKNSCPLLAGAKKAADDLLVFEASLSDSKCKVNPFAQLWQDALIKRDALGYDQAAHDLIKKQHTDARKISAEKAGLDTATFKVEELTKKIDELRNSMIELRNNSAEVNWEISNLQKRRLELSEKIDGLKENIEAVARCSAELNMLRSQMTETNTEIGRVTLALEQAEKAEASLVQVQTKLHFIEEGQEVYNVLNQACGRKGVPALMLENAIPEIERLSNDLLEKMAGGRFAIRIDTQVTTKSTHEVQEAFRVTVLDGGVDGPYESFSGAERFMIDISLRVAISKFLAHRAGAEIRLLVLDEGLGVCDQDNRQAVMDAIRTVSKDFAITLVITHIAELQDEFSQRIVVTRDAENGSMVEVLA